MQENIDVRMSNYMAILSNNEVRANLNLTGEQIFAMENALKIYFSSTALKYIEDYNREQEQAKANAEFDSYLDNGHPKLDPSEPQFKVF